MSRSADPAIAFGASLLGILVAGVLLLGTYDLILWVASGPDDTNVAVEQEPPTPPSYREEKVAPFLMRVDDYERGVTCYRSTGAGGVWCYESGVTP